MPVKTINIIETLYQHAGNKVKTNTVLREWFGRTISAKVEHVLPLLPCSASFNFLRVSIIRQQYSFES